MMAAGLFSEASDNNILYINHLIVLSAQKHFLA
jgi:hypothetical protein